ncbi:MAG: hypothetical protein KC643_19520 [Nitrospira sp.]|nr:hypothetical protein [Nitrospira sp.]
MPFEIMEGLTVIPFSISLTNERVNFLNVEKLKLLLHKKVKKSGLS